LLLIECDTYKAKINLKPRVLQLPNPKTIFHYKLANKNCTLKIARSGVNRI